MKRLVQKLQRHARPLWLLKRAWLRLCGVEIGRGARIAPGAQVKRQGGRIVIGPDCTIHDGARLLAAGGSIVLGRNCSVNPGCILYGHGGLTVGDDVRMAAYTVLVPANHRFDDPARPICEQGSRARGSRWATTSGSASARSCSTACASRTDASSARARSSRAPPSRWASTSATRRGACATAAPRHSGGSAVATRYSPIPTLSSAPARLVVSTGGSSTAPSPVGRRSRSQSARFEKS